MDMLVWLIVIAAFAVAAVYIYNRREEARFRRESERAFGGQDGDALMESDAPRGATGERIEPQLQADTGPETPGPAHRREPRAIAEPAPELARSQPAAGSIAAAMARAQAPTQPAGPVSDAAARAERTPPPAGAPRPPLHPAEAARSAPAAGVAAAQSARAPGEEVRAATGGSRAGIESARPTEDSTRPAAESARSPADSVRAAAESARPIASPTQPVPPPRAPAEVVSDPICYCAELYANEPVSAAALEQLLRAVGPLGARVRLEGRHHAGQPWVSMERSAHGAFPQVRACLQLIDRRGVVGKQDVIVFQSAVARCAASVPASANIPEAEPYLARARELDGFCNEVDVAVGINLVAPRGRPFPGARLRGLAEAAGFRLADGAFAYPDAQGGVRFTLENQEPTRLLGEALRSLQTGGVTLLLDVPRLADGVAAFDEMVAVGRQLAQSLGGTLVDDNSVPVSESGLEQIRNQLRAIYARMQAQGIPAGSPLALRLFS